MIENIKLFVDGHRRLIAIVVCVLGICFFYWWFCYKTNLPSNKVKGGASGLYVVPGRSGSSCYMSVGAKLCHDYVDVENEPLFLNFFVLNKYGEAELGEKVRKFSQNFQTYFQYLAGKGNKLSDVIDHPWEIITSSRRTEKFSATITSIGKYLAKYKLNYSLIYEKVDFNITTFLPDPTHPFYVHYRKLYSRVKDAIGEYVSDVSYIGQCAVCPTSKKTPMLSDIEWSDNVKGVIDKTVYKQCKENVRSWYKGVAENYFEGCDYRTVGEEKKRGKEKKGDIVVDDKNEYPPPCEFPPKPGKEKKEGKDKKKKNPGWEVADIYPAYKLLEMVYVILSIRVNFRDISDDDYYKMIASYVLYAHLINSFCCVRMDSQWNGYIGNEYVYQYINNINAPTKEFMIDETGAAAFIGEQRADSGIPETFTLPMLIAQIAHTNEEELTYMQLLIDCKNAGGIEYEKVFEEGSLEYWICYSVSAALGLYTVLSLKQINAEVLKNIFNLTNIFLYDLEKNFGIMVKTLVFQLQNYLKGNVEKLNELFKLSCGFLRGVYVKIISHLLEDLEGMLDVKEMSDYDSQNKFRGDSDVPNDNDDDNDGPPGDPVTVEPVYIYLILINCTKKINVELPEKELVLKKVTINQKKEGMKTKSTYSGFLVYSHEIIPPILLKPMKFAKKQKYFIITLAGNPNVFPDILRSGKCIASEFKENVKLVDSLLLDTGNVFVDEYDKEEGVETVAEVWEHVDFDVNGINMLVAKDT